MGIMVYSFLRVMQELYHLDLIKQPCVFMKFWVIGRGFLDQVPTLGFEGWGLWD